MNQAAKFGLPTTQTFLIGEAVESLRDSDYHLARAAATGTIAAIGDLYEKHSRRVYALCLRMTQSPPEAEDLTQEVFIQLLRKIGSFRGDSRFTTWLYRLTVNVVRMHFRYKNSRREVIPDDVDNLIILSQKNKHAVGRQAVDRVALGAAMAQLPAGCRSVFELFDIEGYRHQEIAILLGCTVGTSKSQLHKARRKLRRILQESRSKVVLVASGLHTVHAYEATQVR